MIGYNGPINISAPCRGAIVQPRPTAWELWSISNRYHEPLADGPSEPCDDRRWSDFHWQQGYGAFSISQSDYEAAVAYVANQAERHKKFSFQDEFRRLLALYQVEYDESHVWD
jgi:hypothetical protein